jgi:hypothetical protein
MQPVSISAAFVVVGVLAELSLGLSGSAGAAPGPLPTLAAAHASPVEQVRIYKRGRTPIYPYYYRKAPPGGWDFYLGFVPYAKGDYGTQALQRSMYPQDIEWPKDMRRYGPVPAR